VDDTGYIGHLHPSQYKSSASLEAEQPNGMIIGMLLFKAEGASVSRRTPKALSHGLGFRRQSSKHLIE